MMLDTAYRTRTCNFNDERRANVMGAFLTAPKLPNWSVSAWANVTGREMNGSPRPATVVLRYCTDGRGHWWR